MDQINAFCDLLLSLADVYDMEDRDGARELVNLYRMGAQTLRPTSSAPYAPMNMSILAATEGAKHPAAIAARGAHGVLPWSRTGILDDQITDEVSNIFAVARLVGPGALIESESVLAGLFVQRSGAFYPAHAHSAEETYAMLAGTAEWQVDFGAFERRGAGDLIHHPSYAPHATRTGALPILAAWRWSGDVRPDTYRMVDAP